jgi:hypothetical protein
MGLRRRQGSVTRPHRRLAHVVRNNVEIAVSVDKGGRITAQPADKQLAARCNQLYAIASRSVSGGAGAEGSLGANMSVIAAGLA